jgi:hypothetical protein
MSAITYRMAGPEDAALLADLGRRTFTETFGHLYKPADLAAFLESHVPEKWAAELADPAFAVRLAEENGDAAGYAKLGPPSLPFEPRGPSIELRQFYVRAEALARARHRAGADGVGSGGGQGAACSRNVPLGFRRQPSREAVL